MMNQVYAKLPDDRPITSLCVVEDPDKCPKGYTVVSKTYDQDSDADLWKESGFFGRKCTRYLCLSKTEGVKDFVIQSLLIISEKEVPPPDFKTIPKTSDSEQKAWRKRQLCYKYAQITTAPTSITDIIILGKMKKAPEGFTLFGDINGLNLCYRTTNNVVNRGPSFYPQLPYPFIPNGPGNPSPSIPSPNYQNLPGAGGSNGAVADNGRPLLPYRPAPKPPTSTYGTITGYNGLEGVPFVLNSKYSFSRSPTKDIPIPKLKTRSQIDEEYRYEFRTEHQT